MDVGVAAGRGRAPSPPLPAGCEQDGIVRQTKIKYSIV